MTQSEKTDKLNAIMQLQIEEMTKIIDAKKVLDELEKMQAEVEAIEVEVTANV